MRAHSKFEFLNTLEHITSVVARTDVIDTWCSI